MERLLQEDEDEDLLRGPPEVGAGDFNGNSSESQDKEFFNRIAAEIDQDNNQMAVDNDDEEDDDDEEEEEEEGEEEEEDDDEDEDEECSNGSPGDVEAGELLTNGVGDENHSNNSQLNEEWQSGRRNDGLASVVFLNIYTFSFWMQFFIIDLLIISMQEQTLILPILLT